jgi:hypothetical protein
MNVVHGGHDLVKVDDALAIMAGPEILKPISVVGLPIQDTDDVVSLRMVDLNLNEYLEINLSEPFHSLSQIRICTP